ncbi:MAG: hypothetical protein ACOCV8_04415 [Spirochaetota bacterium]
MIFNLNLLLQLLIGFLVITTIVQWFIFFRIFKVLNDNKNNNILHRNEIVKGINHIIENQ